MGTEEEAVKALLNDITSNERGASSSTAEADASEWKEVRRGRFGSSPLLLPPSAQVTTHGHVPQPGIVVADAKDFEPNSPQQLFTMQIAHAITRDAEQTDIRKDTHGGYLPMKKSPKEKKRGSPSSMSLDSELSSPTHSAKVPASDSDKQHGKRPTKNGRRRGKADDSGTPLGSPMASPVGSLADRLEADEDSTVAGDTFVITGLGEGAANQQNCDEPPPFDLPPPANTSGKKLEHLWTQKTKLTPDDVNNCQSQNASLSQWQENGLPATEIAVSRAFDFLNLPSVLQSARICKTWQTFAEKTQVQLPPPQVDSALQFWLLEVLCDFDDNRLPLPMSAIYGEMCAGARRTWSCDDRLAKVEAQVIQMQGPANKTAQVAFLEGCRPHHIAWPQVVADLRRSGFKSLEKMGNHYHKTRLIDVFNQRWRKRIHHSPNIRVCTEWLLTKVNREHPMYVEHSAWRDTLTKKETELSNSSTS